MILWKSNKSKLLLLAIYPSWHPLRSLKNQELIFDTSIYKTSFYKNLFPYFYPSSSQNGWLCKICPNFTPCSRFQTSIEKVGGLGDHPSQIVEFRIRKTLKNWLFKIDIHLCIKFLWKLTWVARLTLQMPTPENGQTQSNNLSESDWLSLFDHFVGLVLKGFKKTTHEWFVLKSLFHVIHFLVLKNWAYTHNFKDSVELISQFGGNQFAIICFLGPRIHSICLPSTFPNSLK